MSLKSLRVLSKAESIFFSFLPEFSLSNVSSYGVSAPLGLTAVVLHKRDVKRSIHLAGRRSYYNDSIEVSTTIKEMKDVNDILHYYANHSDMNIITLETTLRSIAKLINTYSALPQVAASSTSSSITNINHLIKDERFSKLMDSICGAAPSADGRSIAMLANACAYFRASPPQITTLLDVLCAIILKRENSFSPRNLSTIALAFSILNYKNDNLIEFLRLECLKCINDFSPSDLYVTLEAYRRFGVFNRELTDMIIEKMIDNVDKFTSKDVVETIQCLAQAGLARGFLLRRLSVLAFENLNQFSPRQLVTLLHSLNKLRFLKIQEVNDILNILKPQLHNLHYNQISQLLLSLTLCDYIANENTIKGENLINELIEIYTEKDDNSFINNKSISSLADFVYSLSYFQLFEQNHLLTLSLSKILSANPIKNRFILGKIWEVYNSIQIENQNCKIDLPFDWKNAMEEADRLEQDKSEHSRVHNEILILLDGLRGKYKLNMLRNKSVQNYKVEFLDEESKIVLEIDLINKHTNKVMKHRHLSKLGYIPVCINYWLWRRCRSEEDQIIFLKEILTPALIKAGKLTPDSLNINN